MENVEKVFKKYKKLSDEEKIEFKNKLVIDNEWDYLNLLSSRANTAQELLNVKNEQGVSYISSDWVVKNILKLSDEDLKK